MNRKIITFGTFDVFHVGHLNLLERARALGDSLVVGISTDELNLTKKDRAPVFPEQERARLVASLRCVDQVFFEESLAYKREYIERNGASVLVMGDDWKGKFDDLRDACDVVYLPRTPSISTTATIERIRG
ncbi:MAG: glycerol-3-phosphate cytidylyltransferase [Spongiibacteraceae bacterium]|nr:glycerol-3-phosphate cytidylyltransferase [Spongiibacteraceae bacterium]|tara:strand:- start:510 stop:902 length:393 start_codon:yes stop_codon:yes gene_type:complete